MTSSANGVFCDYLDVTFAPTDFPYRELTRFLNQIDGHCSFSDSMSETWGLGEGVLKLEQRARFARVSASGAVLAYLRQRKVFEQYLSLLGDSPHRVTRCDVSLDFPVDGAKIIRSLRRKFPKECALTRKPQQTEVRLKARASDGVQTGTFYVGHRGKGKVTACVYDKSHEAWEKRKQELPPTTRFEIRVSKDLSPTLRDAALPESMFWHFAAPSLLKRPPNVPQWEPVPLEGWSMPVQLHPPADVLKRRVENSADIRSLIALAHEVGPNGPEYMQSLIQRLISAYRASDSHSDPVPDLFASVE